MAVDMFLKLEGIKGESKDSKHPDEIEILSFQWGVSNEGTLTGGSSFQDFAFTADTTRASPQLFLACASGQHVEDGVLTVRKPGADPFEYYIIKLADVQVSSYVQAASSAGEPMDEFSINYAKIEIEYRTQKPDGTFESTRAGWDLSKNVKV